MEAKTLNIHPVAAAAAARPELDYNRKYSITSYILMFFVISFIGWLWEVGLHLVTDGSFVNRGSMFGPWLPIYGTGGVGAIILLRRFGKNKIVLFLLVTAVCLTLEYFTSYYLEKTRGIRWWDYSNAFLNLHGRICFKGGVTFGLGGCFGIYVLGPVLDNMFKKIPKGTKITLCVVLISLFGCDAVYSHFHPNTGEGITTSSNIRLRSLCRLGSIEEIIFRKRR